MWGRSGVDEGSGRGGRGGEAPAWAADADSGVDAPGDEPDPRSGGRVLAVVGASGGCGASCLAVASALAGAAAGLRVVAVDLQPGGAGLDVVAGVEHLGGLRWADLVGCRGADGAALLARLPRQGDVAVLSHGRDGRPVPERMVVLEVVEALRQSCDLLVLDLPRGWWWPTARLTVDQAVVVAGVALVQLAALAATAAVVGAAVAETSVVLRGERARDVVDDVRDALDLPVIGLWGEDAGVPRALSRGEPPGGRAGPLATLARAVVEPVLEQGLERALDRRRGWGSGRGVAS